MARRVTKSEYETLANFRYALRQLLHSSETAAQSVGLTPQQHQALLAIKGHPGRDHVTVGELAERLQIEHHSAVGLVNRLVSQGLAQRERSNDDKRRVHVALTPQGEQLLERLAAAHRAELRRISPELQAFLVKVGGNGNSE